MPACFEEKDPGWTAWSWVDDPHLTEDDRSTSTVFGKPEKDALLVHASGE